MVVKSALLQVFQKIIHFDIILFCGEPILKIDQCQHLLLCNRKRDFGDLRSYIRKLYSYILAVGIRQLK